MMASRLVMTSPAHRTVLQATNNNIAEKENQRGVILHSRRLGKEFSDSETEDWSNAGSRKRRAMPNYVTNSDGPHPRRRVRMNGPEASDAMPSSPLPTHVIARRNERERNRVRQVNDSFAVLRSRIPDYLYEAEVEEANKNTRKKLSKVETLRLAVDYIQQLEVLLNIKADQRDDESNLGMSDEERFQFESETQVSSVKTELESDIESDIMDLSKDADPSPDSTVSQTAFKDVPNGPGLDIDDVSSESLNCVMPAPVENSPSATSPLPPIGESFPTESIYINYSDLYVPYGLVDLSTKCD